MAPRGHRQPRKLLGLRQFGRFDQQRADGRELDCRRPPGGEELGLRERLKQPVGHGLDAQPCAFPVSRPDRRENAAPVARNDARRRWRGAPAGLPVAASLAPGPAARAGHPAVERIPVRQSGRLKGTGRTNASIILAHQQQEVAPGQRLVGRPLKQPARVEGGDGANALRPCGRARAPWPAARRAGPGPGHRRTGPAARAAPGGHGRARLTAQASSSSRPIRAPGAWKQAREA